MNEAEAEVLRARFEELRREVNRTHGKLSRLWVQEFATKALRDAAAARKDAERAEAAQRSHERHTVPEKKDNPNGT